MPRIRTIKPEFFTSLTIASLPVEARLTFIGLWTHVDDEGRCVDDARLVKAAIWPLDDRLASDVELDLKTLTEASLIARYTVSGRSYLAVIGWDEHQRINRPTKSRIPAPSEADEPAPTSDNAALTSTDALFDEPSSTPHGALTEDSPQERKGKEQGTGNREQGTHAGKPRDHLSTDADFERFWATYPRKEAKGQARKAWNTAIKKANVETIIAGAERYRDRPGLDPAYTAHPSTWLNGERWSDQSPPATNGNGNRSSGANRHIDQLTPEERAARNPFAGAVRASQVASGGTP